MLSVGRIPRLSNRRLTGRAKGEHLNLSRCSAALSGSRCRSGTSFGPGRSLPLSKRRHGSLHLRDTQLRHKAELDYIDYRNLNGHYTEEAQEDVEAPDGLQENGFAELDEDMKESERTPTSPGAWQRLAGMRSLLAYLKNREEFGKRGEGLVLLTVFVSALAFFPPMAIRGCITVAGYLAIASGVVGAIAGVVNLGSSFSPLPVPRTDAAFVARGIFRYVRHPFYSGLLLLSLGLSVVTRNEFRLLMTAILYWILDQTIKGEEKDLEAIYPEYRDYKTKVSRMFPFCC